MAYFEGLADTQMLAMLSCVFSDPNHTSSLHQSEQPDNRAQYNLDSGHRSTGTYLPSIEHIVGLPGSDLDVSPVAMRNGKIPERRDAAVAPIILPTRERTPRLSATTTPSISFRPGRANSDLYEPQNVPFSTSPEQIRHVQRSNSNLASAFAASLSRPLSFSASASSSPPTYPGKRLSPVGSYVGPPPASTGFGGTSLFGKSATITENPRPVYSLPVSDTEEEASSPRKPVFETKLKNQDHFELDGYASVPLLAASDGWRYDAYRDAYADMLFAWELPIQMCEVLNYDSVQSPDAGNLNIHDSNVSIQKSTLDKYDEFDGLAFRDSCPDCTTTINAKAANRSCPNCSTRNSSLLCLFCTCIIRGLASPCLSCGHVLHASCRALLQPQDPVSDDPNEEQGYCCISGCGCRCSEHVFVEVEEPEEPPRKGSQGAETIIVKEGGQPRQDVAYESLARNLGARHLTPKSSQIWRGGEPESSKPRKKSVGSSLR